MSNNNNKEMRPASFRPFMRENVQLIVEPSASFTDGVNPLSAMHEKFSRFNFAIINKGQSSTMNMRFFSDVPESANSYIEFRELANMAKEMHLKAKFTPKQGASTPAFTLVFKSGRDTQGKTAAQVLKENPKGREVLTKQRAFLEENVAKYRSNQQFIDAIDEALALSTEQIKASADSIELCLFKSGLRSNAYKKNSNGKVLCYDGSIMFYPGADSPLKVSITNYYAKTEKTDNGLDKILADTAEDEKSGTINLNFAEALRLFAELEEYFTIKYEELTREGIKQSEEMLAAQRKNSSNTNASSKYEDTPVEPEQAAPTNTVSEQPKKEIPMQVPNTAEIYIESAFKKVNGNIYMCDFKGKMKDGSKGKTTYHLAMDKEKFIGDGDDFNLLFKNAANNDNTLVNVMFEQGTLENSEVFYLIDIIKKAS